MAKSYLDSIDVPKPCDAAWDKMIGDDKKRFCLNCEKDVYNLSAMSRRNARKLVAGNAGRICVRYARLPNGKLYTTDTQLHQITRRTSTIAAGVIATTLSLSAVSYAQGDAVTHKQDSKQKEVAEQTKDKKTKPEIGTSQISFTVVYPNGDAIPKVEVKLTNLNTKKEFIVLTDDKGIARFDSLPKGSYKVNPYYEGLEKQEIYLSIKEYFESNVKIILPAANLNEVLIINRLEIPFFQAVFQEDLESIQDSIDRGFNVKTKDKTGLTALHVAVESGNFEIIKLLFYSGADFNAKDKSQQTPLWMLLDTGADEETSVEILNFLISNGVNINERNDNKETLLMVASRKNNSELVEILLKAGANPNLKDKDGKTALMKTDNQEIKELLKRYGAIK